MGRFGFLWVTEMMVFMEWREMVDKLPQVIAQHKIVALANRPRRAN
jgi:predicted nucleic acid-binding Zn ribbon protein